VAETEKYAHVTFFFNGGVERVYDNESRILIPSPKVATYDLEPEMSAVAIGDTVIQHLNSAHNDFILLNFANSDMVGHTGNLEATSEAVRTVDAQIGRIAHKVLEQGGLLAIVADHGNAEVMVGAQGEHHTQHTTNPVPFILAGQQALLGHWSLRRGGGLKDVAPTLLDAMGLPKPDEMTGESLLIKGGT
jgi:2,3-bisphosphoglycerate-independent phosphoglycerate mutase